MKKAILFTLAALCVSAAQAVTVSWSTIDGKATSYDGKYYTYNYTFNLAQTAGCVTSTINTSINTSSIFLTSIVFAGRYQDNSQAATYAILKNAEGIEIARSNVKAIDPIEVKVNGEVYTTNATKAYELVFDYVEVAVGNNYTLSFYNDEDANSKFGHAVVKNSPTGENAWTPAMRVTGSTTVPEPTALALLALGVTGLALKRKVA